MLPLSPTVAQLDDARLRRLVLGLDRAQRDMGVGDRLALVVHLVHAVARPRRSGATRVSPGFFICRSPISRGTIPLRILFYHGKKKGRMANPDTVAP